MDIMSVQRRINRQIFPQSTRAFEASDLQRMATTVIPLHSLTDNHPAATVIIRDYTLAPKQHLTESCIAHSTYTIIPVAGNVEYSVDGQTLHILTPGETLEFCGCAAASIQFINPFEQELINFLVIETTDFPQGSNSGWVKNASGGFVKSLVPGIGDASLTAGDLVATATDHDELYKAAQNEISVSGSLTVNKLALPGEPGLTTRFDINGYINTLLPVNGHPHGYLLFIGKFGGREDNRFTPSNQQSSMILYVIEGAFEAAECLLEDRDALLLNGFAHIDFEALSNNAILLMMELPPQVV
jgi:hypothetical protein